MSSFVKVKLEVICIFLPHPIMEEGLEKIHSSILLLKKWFGNVILTNAWFVLRVFEGDW